MSDSVIILSSSKQMSLKDTPKFASYLDHYLELDNEGTLHSKLYDKRDAFKFPIVNFAFIGGYIQAALSYTSSSS